MEVTVTSKTPPLLPVFCIVVVREIVLDGWFDLERFGWDMGKNWNSPGLAGQSNKQSCQADVTQARRDICARRLDWYVGPDPG